jgi:hypothetical protein
MRECDRPFFRKERGEVRAGHEHGENKAWAEIFDGVELQNV